MKNKIKELAEIAGLRVLTISQPDVESDLYEKHLIDVEKFADLIIKECQQALRPMFRDMISRQHGCELISQHFKVLPEQVGHTFFDPFIKDDFSLGLCSSSEAAEDIDNERGHYTESGGGFSITFISTTE